MGENGPARTERIDRAERLLQWRFGDHDLLLRALTHRSVGEPHNERLEFLGDALLDAIIAEVLYRRFPDVREGRMTLWRATLVNGEMLASLMRDRQMEACLIAGDGEARQVRDSDPVLADTFEALVAAIYLDNGFVACQEFVLEWYGEHLDRDKLLATRQNAKSRLQERVQAQGMPPPVYNVLENRADDGDRQVTVRCQIAPLGAPPRRVEARAADRRRAEQQAAGAMLDLLEQDSGGAR